MHAGRGVGNPHGSLPSTPGRATSRPDRNRAEDAPIGLIPVDSLYSPVRKVSYKVENTREGQVLDYDKLTLTLETDGSITGEDAVAFAARILQDQLGMFVNFDEPQKGGTVRAGYGNSPSIPRFSRRSTSWSFPSVRPTV